MTQFITYQDKTFTMSGKMNIYKISQIKRVFLEKYNTNTQKNSEVFLDLSAVEAVDSSFLQILISFQKTLSKDNNKLIIQKSCSAFDSLLDLFQIPSDLLGRNVGRG